MQIRAIARTAILILGAFAPMAAARGLVPARSWDEARAAHLLRRAGFGGTPDEVRSLAAMTISDAVDHLVDYEKTQQTHPDYQAIRGANRPQLQEHARSLSADERREWRQKLQQLDRLQIEELRAWWIKRMIRSPRPLEEKMTLFWHSHFTSGHREVRNSTWMYDQNAMMRQHALGDYRTLLIAVSQNPAMLRYLDNASNRRQAPNENYARELLELFTLGVGNYTESDIKEAARALTGWTIREGEFASVRHQHDRGQKRFLGQEGNFNGEDIIDIILEQRAASEYLARKLVKFFLTDDPPDALVEDLATVVRATRFNLRETMRAFLKSEAFYDPECIGAKIKSPVELVVSTVRLLEVDPDDVYAISAAASGMGQTLFQPPNVKGWDGGPKWINTATIFARYNFATGLLTGTESRDGGAMMMSGNGRKRASNRLARHREDLRRNLDDYPGLVVPRAQVSNRRQPPFDPSPIIQAEKLYSIDKALNHLIARLLPVRVDPAQRRELRKLLSAGRGKFDARSAEGKRRIVSLINALLAMPEYQLN